ncbi:MAG: heavy metal translocating P-type ATPase metal-binding domain-containing protein [Akkermansiaceae bacterium]|nr:heavy metal translocating P-type ATPase metal-binding domain-containing protein [Akkermansiaceae bacterium]
MPAAGPKTGPFTSADETAESETDRVCVHCGTRYRLIGAGDTRFCCSGCRFVHELIANEGLDRFYDLRGNKNLQPVKSVAFQRRDFDWLHREAAAAEAGCGECGEAAKLTLDLQGISCAACVWLIERVFRRFEGGLRILVDAQLGLVRLWWEPGRFDPVQFAAELQRFGYAAGPATDATAGAVARTESRALLTRAGVTGGLAMNAMAFTLPRYLGMADDFFLARLFEMIAMASATLALLAGGGYFFRRAWRALSIGSLHMDLPISLGLIAAWGGSVAGWALRVESLLYFDFVAVFAFLMLGGRWLQQSALEKNRAVLLAGAGKIDTVTVPDAEASGERAIPVAELAVGDTFLVKPGETLPVAGVLMTKAGAELSHEWINGEPEPRALNAGAEAPAGAVNAGRRSLTFAARERHADSLLARLLAVTEDAARSGEHSRDLGRVLRVYLGLVLLAAFGGAGVWLARGAPWPAALQVLISVLVVSCPCALGVALPLLDELVVARLRRAGLFVQNAGLWSRLRHVRRLVFDKTGTLTRETPRLVNDQILAALDPESRRILAALVRDSRHPAGRAIREALAMADPAATAAELSPIEETVAHGVAWTDPGRGLTWSLGKPGWRAEAPSAEAGARLVFARDAHCLAAFVLEEALRDDAVAEVGRFRRLGYELAILSGDSIERVGKFAAGLGIDPANVVAGASPAEKAAWVAAHDPGHTLYLGDGANDSLAFDAAACRGTPAIGSGVLERKSDFYFLGQGIGAIGRLLALASRRRRIAAAILAVAIVYNVAAVAVALAGWMNPLLAAVLMPISSVVTLALAAAVGREKRSRA